MRKSLGFISALSLYISSSALALAADTSITIKPPTGSITDITLANIPQFIIQLLFAIGIIVVIAYLIYGGIKWVMSGGDKAGVEAARNHIVAAIVGLVIIVGAFLIINIVFTLLTGKGFNPFATGGTGLSIPGLDATQK